jgi:hypothetical protein
MTIVRVVNYNGVSIGLNENEAQAIRQHLYAVFGTGQGMEFHPLYGMYRQLIECLRVK